jgi:RNA polymerase sigma factor (sigma-70 family)
MHADGRGGRRRARGRAAGRTPLRNVAPSADTLPPAEAARFDAAVAVIASYGAALRRTARRHSLCADDAEDAYQRALEILLVKAPPCELPRLAAWMHTVTKREAMAVRRSRERLLGPVPRGDHDGEPPGIDSFPAERPGPAERAERRERVARSSQALAALKPQERRALVLKAQGYSYAEIQRLCGWTYTKVNRCMAEGRKAFLERFAEIYG